MLTDEGIEAARVCMVRSGLSAPLEQLTAVNRSNNSFDEQRASPLNSTNRELAVQIVGQSCEKEPNDTSTRNFAGDIVVSSDSDSDSTEHISDRRPSSVTLTTCSSLHTDATKDFVSARAHYQNTVPNNLAMSSFNPKDVSVLRSLAVDAAEQDMKVLSMPPGRYGEKFEEIYDVILILDDRENFGSHSKKVVDNISSQFKVLVEVRRLPVGDRIWILRHKQSNKEYVLDIIVETKKVDDLCSSIRDNRYRDQKLRLQKCGLRKLIYLVEGDPNSLETAETIKTACFTTEVLEGFDVQRTSGFADTVRKYGHLTKSITQYYSTYFSCDKSENRLVCLAFNDFIKKCQDLEKMTVSDVFALQLIRFHR